MKILSSCRGAALLALVLLLPASASAQLADDWDTTGLLLTRAGLERLLARYERANLSSAYSVGLREDASEAAVRIRTRLREGDFRVGDQIVLNVQGEEMLSDTFAVRTGRVISLPLVGDIPLAGVLRSELDARMTEYLSQFVQDPIVRTRSLIRIAVLGEVARQGFYMVPSDILLTDVLMRAGGPAGTAQLLETRIERAGEELWSGSELRVAITEGRTLDQLGLRAGDRIIVPREAQWNWGEIMRWVGMAVPAVVYLATEIF